MKLYFDEHGYGYYVASSREDAWIETTLVTGKMEYQRVASSREDAWIETASPAGIR